MLIVSKILMNQQIYGIENNNSNNNNNNNDVSQSQKQTQPQQQKPRQGITLIYDLLKAMMETYKPMPKTRIFQAAQLNGKQGPKLLRRALILGYIQPSKKKGQGGRYKEYTTYELTQQGITHIYNIEQFHHANGVILRASRRFGL